MKIAILSDLHLEFAHYAPSQGALACVDAVILAGDIMSNTRKLPTWLTRPSVFGASLPIVIVLGNHEFYSGEYHARRRELREAAARHATVYALDPGEVIVNGVRLLGCTLWTDFELAIGRADGTPERRARAMSIASKFVNDYQAIRIADHDGQRQLKPADTVAFHRAEHAWLLAKLQEPFSGKTVVVTHHAPSPGSVADEYATDTCTPAFVSNLQDEFFQVPTLWVHGHTHSSFDYVRGNTRVVCNPRGYRMRDGAYENANFDPARVVDTDRSDL